MSSDRKVESVDRMHFEGSVSLYTFYLSINAKSYSLVIRAVSKVWRLKPCHKSKTDMERRMMRQHSYETHHYSPLYSNLNRSYIL